MSERYSRVFSLPQDLYVEGSPVIISGGTLLKDAESGMILAQLKFLNICAEKIKALRVSLSLQDTAGAPLSCTAEHQYLDLSVARDQHFGQREAILLPDNTARAYSIASMEVIFADNSVWKSAGAQWEALPKPASVSTIADSELRRQYKMYMGENCRNIPLEWRDLWYCTCGAVNHAGEGECHACRNTLTWQLMADFEELEEAKNARLEQERRQEEKRVAALAAERAEQEAAAAKKKKKTVTVILAVALALAVIFGSVLFYEGAKDKTENCLYHVMYQTAKEVVDNKVNFILHLFDRELVNYVDYFYEACSGDYEQREEMLTPYIYHERFGPSACNAINEAIYEEALRLEESGNYLEAAALAEQLLTRPYFIDYHGSAAEIWRNSVRTQALAYYNGDGVEQDYEKAAELFLTLKNNLDDYFPSGFIGASTEDICAEYDEMWHQALVKASAAVINAAIENEESSDEALSHIQRFQKQLESSEYWYEAEYLGEFMTGYWSTKDRSYHIKFYHEEGDDSLWCNHNLPSYDAAGYYTLKKGIFTVGEDESNRTKYWKFTLLDWDEISVYCYKNDKTYTLYRR